jgi:isopenicillin N synthase-like dioxygenase
VKNPHTGAFQPAPPIVSLKTPGMIDALCSLHIQPGTIVVNAGDLLARWSKCVLCALTLFRWR